MYVIVTLGETPSAPVNFFYEIHQILIDFYDIMLGELHDKLPFRDIQHVIDFVLGLVCLICFI